MSRYLFTIILFLGCPVLFAADEADKAIHDELRVALKGIEKAINTQKYSEMKPYFHKNLRITTINQEVLSKRDDIDSYFKKWFGPKGYLKKLEIRLIPDAKTEFYANKTIGIVRGKGIENYVLSDTRYFPMKTRWTATVIKDTDDKWRILALHIGTDFLDNPVLSAAKNSLIYFSVGSGAGGFILCLILGFLIRRRRKA